MASYITTSSLVCCGCDSIWPMMVVPLSLNFLAILSATHTRLRPLRLARYNASSAARNNSGRELAFNGTVAIPIDAVRFPTSGISICAIFNGRLMGVLQVTASNPNRVWQESEILLLRIVADQVAVA